MMKNKKYLLILAISLLLLAPVFNSLPASAQTSTKPETIHFITEPDAEEGITKLENEDLDIYASKISEISLYERVENSPELDFYENYGFYNELSFNPAGPVFDNGKLNPFAIPKIREAMNYLVDREYLAQDVLGGLFTPRWTTFNTVSADANLLASEIRAIELKYEYNKSLAKQIIDAEMLSLGAVSNAGKWYYGGEPVEISILIRIEDERLAVGDYVGDQLEDIGFQVYSDYKSADDASQIWFHGDPNDGGFHIYTGGWITKHIPRDLADSFAFFYTDLSSLSFSPLWQHYVNDPEFYELAERLQAKDFATYEERHTMMARALDLSMEDSVRIFLFDQISITPKRTDIILATDLYGGVVGSQIWAKTIQHNNGDTSPITIGLPSIFDRPWNPVAGSKWLYDLMPIHGTADFGVVLDPYTGLNLPDRIERAEVVVQEGLLVSQTFDWVDLTFEDEIIVPGDAWGGWDAEAQEFVYVDDLNPGETVTALRKSTVYYPEALYDTVKWHEGSPFSIADVLMNMILTFDRGQEYSPIYDESAVPTLDDFMSSFKGVRIISEDPLVIETYSDIYYSDAELSVTTWWPFYSTGQGAWHALNLGIRAEAAEEAAFSNAKATQLAVDWLDFTTGDTVEILKGQLDDWKVDEDIPYVPTMTDYIETDELNTRLGNLSDWHDQHGHFWIGTGPYFLETADRSNGTLTLQQTEYQVPGDEEWSDYAESPSPNVQVSGTETIEQGDEAVYDISITQGDEERSDQLDPQRFDMRNGQPYPSKDIAQVAYLLVGQNKVYLSGQTVFIEEGLYRVVVDRDMIKLLPGGAINLEVIVVSKRICQSSSVGVSIDNQNYTNYLPLTLR